MKPPPFDYHDPKTLDEALALLAEHQGEAAVLAGGQSLVPLLNVRKVTPKYVIDINSVAEISALRPSPATLRIGAMTRQAEIERSSAVAERWPLLREAVGWVAHPQIRSRGTVGGSVMNADPTSEIPAALVALDARFEARSVRGTRTLGWREFFPASGGTALGPDELLVGIEVPPLPERTGTAFVEYARRHRHRSLGGAAVVLTLDAGGVCTDASVALLGAAARPHRSELAEEVLTGAVVDAETAAAAARAATAAITPPDDVHGSAEYRASLIGTLLRRAIGTAAERAGGS
ncbi:xanthine dehydrogenase family protein subunit M [Streptomyces sp. NPDC002896]|uniref:FAD binding domain-containing protein n=1 Tax=Streptomyces sp. NPDC002896 TaxID=3154438 RepID=UPI0033320107